MDINALHACFTATLDSDLNIRNQAEQQLKNAEKTPGFINGCLEIVLEENVTIQVKKAAAIYLKNRILKRWSPENTNPIDLDEKPIFRERLIPALHKAPSFIRPLLVASLNHIVEVDFPAKWPQLLDITIALLSSDDVANIQTGLTCLLEIFRRYRYSRKEPAVETLNRLVTMTFPRLLEIGNNLVKDDSQNSGEMVRDITKIFKMAIYQNLPHYLKNTSNLAGWLELLLSIFKKPYSTELLNIDEDERILNPWVKSKKWVSYDIWIFFKRYVLKKQKIEKLANFAETFETNFIPEIFNIIFSQLTAWVEGKEWIAPETQFHVLTFLTDCVRSKLCWQLLEPHVQTIISHVLFPLLCPTEADVETFDAEPEAFIMNEVQFSGDDKAPDNAANGLFFTLMRNRTNTVFNGTLQFFQEIAAEHERNPQNLELSMKKDGVLKMLSSMPSAVMKYHKALADKLESVIMHFIVSDFESPFGFLRARVCATVNSFSEIGFKDEQNIATIYQNIMKCLNDKCLPVQVEASLALQMLVREDNFRLALSDHIPRVMQHLLNLSSKLDMDALSGVMEQLVQTYSEQLSPFAVQLAQQMADQFMNQAAEFMDRNDDSDELSESLDDKIMAASGILTTLQTLISSLDSDRETLVAIEQVLMPIFVNVIGHGVFDFLADVLSLLESLIYYLSSIDDSMWQVFILIGRLFDHQYAADYLDEIEPVMQNYIAYGQGTLSTNPAYLDVIYKIYEKIMSDDERSGANEKTKACSTATGLILSEKGRIDETALKIVQIAVDKLNNLKDEDVIAKLDLVALLKVVIAGIYYNPPATLAILNSKGATDRFLNLFIGSSEGFLTVYDIKIGVIGLFSLLTIQDDLFDAVVRPSLFQLNSILVALLAALPKAIIRRAKIHDENAAPPYIEGMTYGQEQVWGFDEENDDEEPIETEPLSANEEYRNFLKEQSQIDESQADESDSMKFFNPSSAELMEELIINTPLDSFNIFAITRDTLMHMSQTNNSRYEEIVGKLTDEGRERIKETIDRANLQESQQASQQAGQDSAK